MIAVLGTWNAAADTSADNGELKMFDEAMRGICAQWQIPGATLAVLHQDRLVLSRGYGVANVTTGEPMAEIKTGVRVVYQAG